MVMIHGGFLLHGDHNAPRNGTIPTCEKNPGLPPLASRSTLATVSTLVSPLFFVTVIRSPALGPLAGSAQS